MKLEINKSVSGAISAVVIMIVVYILCMLVFCLILAAAQTFILFENHFYVHLWHPVERAAVLTGSVIGLVAFIWKVRKN